jgi:DNA polymerase-3 subunit alpha
LPLVATNDCHYLNRSDATPHDVLLCIGTAETCERYESHEIHLRRILCEIAQEMAEVFADYPEALHNTLNIAERCQFQFEFGHNILPEYQVPEGLLSIPTWNS